MIRMLVESQTEYKMTVPIMLGTNLINCFYNSAEEGVSV